MNDVYLFGWGKYGQLGQGDEQDHLNPKILDRSSVHGSDIKDLSCGFCYNVGITSRGHVYSWGYNKHGQLAQTDYRNISVPHRVKELQKLNISASALGYEHTLALTKDGNVYSCGSGAFGMLGNNSENDVLKPVKIDFFGPESLNRILVKQIACGLKHSLAVDKQHLVYSWGFGKNGRLGHDNEENCLEPRCIEALQPSNVVLSYRNSLELDSEPSSSSSAEEKGDQPHEEIKVKRRRMTGLNRSTISYLKPLAMAIGTLSSNQDAYDSSKHGNVISVHCGWNYSCVLTSKGNVCSWGYGKDYSLGLGEDHVADVLTPTVVTTWEISHRSYFKKRASNTNIFGSGGGELPTGGIDQGIFSLHCGGKHVLALTEGGTVYSWGRGEFGRLGHGDEEHRGIPCIIDSLYGKEVVALCAGGYHSGALTAVGHVYTWGSGEFGRLGHGDEKDVLYPKKIQSLEDRKVSKLFAGAYITGVLAETSVSDSQSSCCIL